ncbi:MAG: hypothetical protein JO112_02985 [Planctomycetes bacterium]|nr:hypothetical protein [Planctomycetota bacterium]
MKKDRRKRALSSFIPHPSSLIPFFEVLIQIWNTNILQARNFRRRRKVLLKKPGKREVEKKVAGVRERQPPLGRRGR